MHTAIIGASKGIGRATALQLLHDDPSNTISLLLRSPSTLEADDALTPAIAQGRVTIIQGDAYVKDDLRRLIGDDSTGIDAIVSTLAHPGAVYPDGKRQFSWSKGFLLPSPDVCTRSTLALVQVVNEMVKAGRTPPALAVISVTRVGGSAQYLPYAYQLILPWLLQQTIDDKRGVETILSHVAASTLPSDPDLPSSAVLDPQLLSTLDKGFLQNVLIVRPAQLKDTNGTAPLRAGEQVSTYSTGRVELGRWIAKAIMEREEWTNRRVTVGF